MILEIIGALIRWTFVISWRFFTGAHMDGDIHTDATFFKPATSRHKKRQQTNAAWKCMSRWQRMKWRNGIFWPIVLLFTGFIWSPSSMLFLLGIMAPGLLLIFRHRFRLAFYLPVVGHHSDGSVKQHWILKPKYRRMRDKLFRPEGRRKRPGLALESELMPGVSVAEIPADYEAAVRAELAEELDGQPSAGLRLLMDPDNDFG